MGASIPELMELDAPLPEPRPLPPGPPRPLPRPSPALLLLSLCCLGLRSGSSPAKDQSLSSSLRSESVSEGYECSELVPVQEKYFIYDVIYISGQPIYRPILKKKIYFWQNTVS